MPNETERREFLKAAGTALGGIAVAGIVASEASAAPARMAGKQGAISFRCDPNIKIDSIFEAVKQAVGRYGCPTCGLLGLDLHFGIGPDPEPFGVNVPGIHGASFMGGGGG